MAKPNRNTVTRLATTVNARYFVSSGATDTFYLDGRLTGKRERRAADITLDREERGFFLSVFAHVGGQSADEVHSARLRKSLDRILNDVKNNGRNIDAEINELAECAVDISGRMTLQNDGVRQPYFAGIIVKDAEIAAITMGGGCTWLYRGDVLYPLTSDDCQLEAIDLNGKDVPGHDVYCAGIAGTVRYSNIAQLQEDDCIITCNKEVFDALGQREILRLLYEAEDQADAAGLIITAAAAKLPGVPLQFMIGFVEGITAVEKPVRAGFGRSFAGMGAGAALKTGSAKASAASRQEPIEAVPEQPSDYTDNYGVLPPEHAQYNEAPVAGIPVEPVGMDYPDGDYDDEDGYDVHEDEYYDEYDNTGRTRKLAFYIILAAICIGCLFAIYHMLFGREDEPQATTTLTAITTTADAGETTTTAPIETTETSAVETEETTEAPAETTTEAPVETTTEAPVETTTEAPAETTAAPSGDLIATHTVSSGETLYRIAEDYYGSAGSMIDGQYENVTYIMNYNGFNTDVVQVGQEIKIPVKD